MGGPPKAGVYAYTRAPFLPPAGASVELPRRFEEDHHAMAHARRDPSAPGTQEDDRARLLAWAARTAGIPDPDDLGLSEGLSEWDAGPYGLGGYG